MVKIQTNKKHRFGRSTIIGGQVVNIDAQGYAEVHENLVSQALIAGFELVDKDAKFTSEEEKAHIGEVNAILESARAQAAEIIAKAEAQAAEIIAKAEAEAGHIAQEAQVDEKAEKRQALLAMKVADLQALCADSKIPEDQWKSLKKAELVDLLMSFIFDEGTQE